MTSANLSSHSLKVAIIGSGPSGFYAAEALFKQNIPIKIDMFEKLPTPFGLLRGGIAPDHQQMKSLQNYYEKIVIKHENQFELFANIHVGQDISIKKLREYYDALIFCYGTEQDRRLNIKNETLSGIHSATAFVGWYNGHPNHTHHKFNQIGRAHV